MFRNLFSAKTAPVATAPTARVAWDDELDMPIGEAGSKERFLWILADQDRQDREDAEIERIIAARQN
jgi:hypothetical protein